MFLCLWREGEGRSCVDRNYHTIFGNFSFYTVILQMFTFRKKGEGKSKTYMNIPPCQKCGGGGPGGEPPKAPEVYSIFNRMGVNIRKVLFSIGHGQNVFTRFNIMPLKDFEVPSSDPTVTSEGPLQPTERQK